MSTLNILVGDVTQNLKNFKPSSIGSIICLLPIQPYAKSSVPNNQETLNFYYQSLIGEFKRILDPSGSLWVIGKYDPIIYASYFLKSYNFYIINSVTILHTSQDVAISRSLSNCHYTANWFKPHKSVPHIFNSSEDSDIWDLSPKDAYKKMARISYNPRLPLLLPFYNSVAFKSCLDVTESTITIKAEG